MHHTKDDVLCLGLTPADIKHNQHRRAPWADYSGTGLYMVTLFYVANQIIGSFLALFNC